MATLTKLKIRHTRLRKKIAGTSERPRLAVHFSGKHIYAQVIDDSVGRTLVAAATTEKEIAGESGAKANKALAEVIGRTVAERSRGANISKVVFDRGGFLYHGKVKALADAAREAGLEF